MSNFNILGNSNHKPIVKMDIRKKYSGYKSFQYLEPNIDYKSFKLAKEVGRVEPYVVPLSKSEEERVEEILKKDIVISLHDHPSVFPEDMRQVFEYNRHGRVFTGYEGLSVSGLDAVFDNMMDGMSVITSKKGWKWSDVIYELGMKLSDIAHQNFVTRCERVSDIIEAHETGKVAIIPTLESSKPIENEVDRVDVLYGLGVRSMGIVFSESNMLGSGQWERRDGGLTDLGHDVVKRMNKIGMAIDAAHAGPQTVLDTIEASNRPIFISHCGARTLGATTMNAKSDEVLQALAAKGGVVGIAVAGLGLPTMKHPEHDIEGYMEHIEYCINLLGIDHVGCGPDTLYGDHVGLYRFWFPRYSGHYGSELTADLKVLENVEYIKGLENPSDFPNIPRWLVKNGYSNEEITKIIGGNALRVLKEVW